MSPSSATMASIGTKNNLMKTTMMTMKMIGKVFLCMLPVIAFMVWYSSQVNKMMNDPVVEAQMTAQAHCNWQNDPIVDCKALSVN